MGGSVVRVKEWMGMETEPPDPGGRQVRRLRMDEVNINDYLVFWVRSSMYRDKDGSVAHEFYEEELRADLAPGTKRLGMRRVLRDLVKEERELLPFPALSSKLPVIFYSAEQ